ncbi:MAG: hypothetical protein MUF58_18055 [Arcicella sp.]|jgi:hypothetical protein|nr:hypothetical protein [Arcicella sp.]
MTTVADKERIRMSLKNLVLEEPNFIDDLVSELSEDLKKSKQNRLERIINEDFEEYKEVFKALAS